MVAQMVKHLPAMQETWVQSLGWEDPLEKEMATHSSTLAWKILWAEEPGRLQSMGSQKVRCDWATSLHFFRTLSQISDGYVFALNTQENNFILNNPKQKSLNKAISKIRALNIYGHLCRQNNYKETLCLVTGPIIKNDNDGVSYQLGNIYPSLTRYATCKVWENESENEVAQSCSTLCDPMDGL